jgi:hypothetical protein
MYISERSSFGINYIFFHPVAAQVGISKILNGKCDFLKGLFMLYPVMKAFFKSLD